MLQFILVSVMGLAAVSYLGWLVYQSFASESCESGCGKCGTLDIKAILKSVEEKKKASS